MSIPESILRHPLPPVPEWFLKELPKVATRNGVPMFRIVNGQTEQHFRCGKMTLKHTLKANGYPFFVTVSKTRFRRRNFVTGDYHLYRSYDGARADKNKDLGFEIDVATKELRVPVGRACWVIEVYISPEEIDESTWLTQRYDFLEKNKIEQKIDILGPYPRDGYYTACFDVVSEDGKAVAPSDKTIEECKRRLQLVSGDTRTVEQAIQAQEQAMDLFEQKQLDLMNENFTQWAGITGNRRRGGVVGKPITQVREQ